MVNFVDDVKDGNYGRSRVANLVDTIKIASMFIKTTLKDSNKV